MGKKLKTKSILACAVLASVLAGGFFVSVAEAGQVKALVAPKDFDKCVNGKEVIFGQKRGYSDNQVDVASPQRVKIFNEKPTWQVVGTNEGEVFLLAKQSWGINRFSDYGEYNPYLRENILIGQYYCREVLNLLNDRKNIFFSADELAYLDTQISYEQERETGHVYINTTEYSGVFALPQKESVEHLTKEQRKRDKAYWLNDTEVVEKRTLEGTHREFYWKVDVVNEDGSITQHYGTETKDVYPTLKLKSVLFAYLGDKSVPSSNFVTSADDSSALHITLKNTITEKDVNIRELSVAKDKMTITADGLATGAGQGLSGILANSNGDYVAYARLADNVTNSRIDNVQIYNDNNRFVDNTQFAAGEYTLQLFNEKRSTDGGVFDYAGNFFNLGKLVLDSNGVIKEWSMLGGSNIPNLTVDKIEKLSVSGDRIFSNLSIGENVNFVHSAQNKAGIRFGSYYSIDCETLTVTNNLNWTGVLNAEGTIDLKGIFSVNGDTLTLVRPTNTDYVWNRGISGWNDIIYNGTAGQSAVLHLNGNMHGLILNGGTFKAEQDLTLTDYLQVTGNGQFETGGTLTVGKSLNLQNGQAQNGIINNLIFGDAATDNRGTYFFDAGLDTLQISGTATGKVKLVSKYNQMLTDNSQVYVFRVSGSGNLDNLTMNDLWITDKANNQTYILTKNKDVKGKFDVKASRHNAVVNFAEQAEGFEPDTVLFATNAENGRGTTSVGMIKLLSQVTGSGNLELVVDDDYVAYKKGTERVTGDVNITNLYLNGSNLNVAYNGGRYVDGNSYLSYFVGEDACPQDYFAYGKADILGRYGSGVSGNISLEGIVTSSAMANKNMTLSFFNEYGNGTSFAGEFKVLPGTLKLSNLNSLTYTVDAGDMAQDISVGKNNVVELTGTGTLAKTIRGEGRVSVKDNITANGDFMQVDFETASGKTMNISGKTMNISGGRVQGSLKGNFNLTDDITFSGKSLQGKITSSSAEKLTLNNDVQVNGDLNIANLDGNSKTLNMQQTDGTATYDTLTIGTLKDNANWAIDVDLVNRKSDKIVLNSVDTGKIITLNAINLVGTLTDDITTIGGVVNGAAKDSVNVASGLFVYGDGKKYSVTLAENDNVKDLKLIFYDESGDIFKDFIESDTTASFAFTDNMTLDAAVTTGSEVADTENITKTVFLNEHGLQGSTTNNGITVANTHTLTMVGGTISGFATALTVNKRDATNFGTLNLKDVTFSGNTTDVANAGIMNIQGSVTMQKLTGDGTTEIQSGAELNLVDDYSANQTFQGDGTLNFQENSTVAADKLGTATNTIATGKKLTLIGGSISSGYKNLNKPVSGGGSIKIEHINFVQTDAANLQAEVENNGYLKIAGINIATMTKGIGGNGSLYFAQNVRIYGAVQQNDICIDEDCALDVYNTLTVTGVVITNRGSICIDAGNLQSDVTNSPGGNTLMVDGYTMYNGAVYLYSSGTPESSTLTKKITNGKVFVLNDVTTSLQNLATGTLDGAGVYLAGGVNLILKGTAEETIGINIKGYESLDALYAGTGTGTLVTDGNYIADLDNVQVPLDNRGTMNLSAGTTVTDMSKMTGIVNSGDLNVGTGISVTGIITNTNNVTLASGATFGDGGKVVGGTLNLGDNIVFSSANLEGLTELNVDNAVYNFKAVLGANPSMDIIDAEKVTGTLKLGTVTPTWNENLSEWELGTTKTVPYLKGSTGNTVAVGNTAVIFSEDNHRFTFSQAKEDNGTDKIGYLAIVKENGGELWQIIRNTEVSGYHCGNVSTYSLTADYTEQMKDATTDTDKLGTLTRTETNTPREFTIEGNGHSFDGNGKNGITVQNAGDILNFSNISDIKGWNDYVVTNNGGTVNFNGTNVLNSKITGTGTFNNNGYLKVADVSNLLVTELHNTSIVDIGNGTDQTLNTKINGGILGIVGNISADAANLAANEIDIAENKTLTVTGNTLGETFVINLGSLGLGVNTNNAFIAGGIVNINIDMTTTHTIMAEKLNLGANTLTVTGADNNTEFAFGKINAINDTAALNITKGKVTAYDEINSKIKLDDSVDLTIAADNIKKNVEIGNNANLNLGDGNLKHNTITSNSGTVNFLGNVKVDTSGGNLSLPKATFANGSTLTVEAKTDTAPIEVTQTITVDPGAKLFVDGAEKNGTYKIVSGTPIDNTFTGWTLSNIRGEDANGRNVKAKEYTIEGNVYSVLFKTAIPENTMLKNILANNNDAPITEFAEQIVDKYYDADDAVADALATNEINSVAALGENLGVSRGAYDVANMVGDAIDKHWDDNRVQDSGVRIQEKRKVWAVGTRNKETVDGVELGDMKAQYDAQYNGAVVGVDWSSNFGMAINYTDGKVNNKLGGHNDAEYYGGSLYAKTDWGNLGIYVNASYTYGKNELSQNGITADAKTETISGGLTLKYMAKAGLNKIGPFAGIRYMHIKGRDYTDSLGINREADKINSMVVPVGLEYSGDFKMKGSDWTWKPRLAAGYLFNLGDRTNDMFLRYNGAMDTFAYDFVDKGAFFANAGMVFEKKNFSLGISYDFMKSKNSKNRRWNVNADVAF